MARRNPVHRLSALQGEGGDRLFRVAAEASSGVALLATSKHGIVFVSTPTLLPLSRRERYCTGKPFSSVLFRPGEGIIGSAAISGTTILANDAQHDPRSVYPPGLKPPIEHSVVAPLHGSGPR